MKKLGIRNNIFDQTENGEILGFYRHFGGPSGGEPRTTRRDARGCPADEISGI